MLIVWLAGGLYTLLGSICLTELGTMAPQAGGYYVYARRAFGDGVGFAVGWTDWLTYCAVLGYIVDRHRRVRRHAAPSLAGAVTPIAIVILVAFVALQWAGVRVSSRFQEVATATEVSRVLRAGRRGAGTLRPCRRRRRCRPALPPVTLAGVIAALQAVVITYGGWQSALYFTEEDRDPSRNLPRAMIGGVLAVIVIYTARQRRAARGAADPGARGLDAAGRGGRRADRAGGRGRQMLTVLSIVSLPPLLNAIMMIGTRILYALGRDGLLLRADGVGQCRRHAGRRDLVTTIVAVVLIATGTFQRLVAMASFFLAANYCICCLALFVAAPPRAGRRRGRSARGAIRGPRRSCSPVRSRFSSGTLVGDTHERAGRDWTRGRRRRGQANDAGSSFTQNVKLLPAFIFIQRRPSVLNRESCQGWSRMFDRSSSVRKSGYARAGVVTM